VFARTILHEGITTRSIEKIGNGGNLALTERMGKSAHAQYVDKCRPVIPRSAKTGNVGVSPISATNSVVPVLTVALRISVAEKPWLSSRF
jgi:hypothetical protein